METSLQVMADRVGVDHGSILSILKRTVVPSGVTFSDEQLAVFVAVANEYKLNPLVKEIYAYPGKGGGIQPVVSVDGWIRIMNSHPNFDGISFTDEMSAEGTEIISITCEIFKKNSTRTVSVPEYMSECRKNTAPWRDCPRRMLRHKALIQCVRYAFGICGIIDADEADRYVDCGVISEENREGKVIDEVSDSLLPLYDDDRFDKLLPKWGHLIAGGKSTAEQIILKLSSSYALTEDQERKIKFSGDL